MAKLFRLNATTKKLSDEMKLFSLTVSAAHQSMSDQAKPSSLNGPRTVSDEAFRHIFSVSDRPSQKKIKTCPSRTVNFVSAAQNNYSDEAEMYSFSGPRKCLTKRIASSSNILPEEAKHFSHSDWQICFNKAEIFRLNAPLPSPTPQIKMVSGHQMCILLSGTLLSHRTSKTFLSQREGCVRTQRTPSSRRA